MSAILRKRSRCCGQNPWSCRMPSRSASRRRLIGWRHCRDRIRPPCWPRCSTASMPTNALPCSRWQRGRCGSGFPRASRRPRSRRRLRSMSRRSRKCGTGSRRLTQRCLIGRRDAARSRPAPTCRCSAHSCWRIRWRICASISPTMPPNGNGTGFACNWCMSPGRRGCTAGRATTSPRVSPRWRAISPRRACSTAN
ncbi:hypothetical protein D9M73_105360 [compost metagenome]